MQPPATREDCGRLDAADPLSPLRQRFALPDGLVYLVGNSLGPPPRAEAGRLVREVEQAWGTDLVRGWARAGWWERPRALGRRLAPLVGAGPDEVIVADSTSVNLFKAVVAAARLRPGRRVIVSDPGSFPTDLYLVQSAADLLGCEHRLARPDEIELAAALDESVAAVVIGHVDYRDARRHDMAALTALVHEAGAMAVWDLCHSAGAIPVRLNECGADLAVGCTYKYLNGGPGAPAFVFCAARHLDGARQPLPGWHGHARPFAFEATYEPAPGIARFGCGTPPVLGLAALEASLDVWEEVDLAALEAKREALGELLIGQVERWCGGSGLELASPRDPDRRGSHLAYRHPRADALVRALAERGVLADFREPGVVRLGLAPLYLRYVDVWDAAERLRDALAGELPEPLPGVRRAAF